MVLLAQKTLVRGTKNTNKSIYFGNERFYCWNTDDSKVVCCHSPRVRAREHGPWHGRAAYAGGSGQVTRLDADTACGEPSPQG